MASWSRTTLYGGCSASTPCPPTPKKLRRTGRDAAPTKPIWTFDMLSLGPSAGIQIQYDTTKGEVTASLDASITQSIPGSGKTLPGPKPKGGDGNGKVRYGSGAARSDGSRCGFRGSFWGASVLTRDGETQDEDKSDDNQGA